MNNDLFEFQKLQIEALKKENEKLRMLLIRKENNLKDYLKRIQDHRTNPDFNKPILNINYNESNKRMA
jgi:hypothetical protein